ncbi:MAG: nuclear transport factor 2 family protein [Burkholderiaceae bacterium]
MHPHRSTLTRFYNAFAHLDPATMARCYAPEAQFQDEVFMLDGRDQVMAMWFMLCESLDGGGRVDWKLNYRIASIDARTARLHWSAHYHFGKAGRPVHNRITASFRFDDAGRITHHHDSFDFWRWSRQALGFPGLLLGWSPLLRRQVRSRAHAGLDRYIAQLQASAPAPPL